MRRVMRVSERLCVCVCLFVLPVGDRECVHVYVCECVRWAAMFVGVARVRRVA